MEIIHKLKDQYLNKEMLNINLKWTIMVLETMNWANILNIDFHQLSLRIRKIVKWTIMLIEINLVLWVPMIREIKIAGKYHWKILGQNMMTTDYKANKILLTDNKISKITLNTLINKRNNCMGIQSVRLIVDPNSNY